jgi:hypothetical protein
MGTYFGQRQSKIAAQKQMAVFYLCFHQLPAVLTGDRSEDRYE